MKTNSAASGFHAGEVAAQQMAGVQTLADRVSSSIHNALPSAARDFLARQPMVIVGYADDAGRQWVSILAGNSGFAYASNAGAVVLSTQPREDDPLWKMWTNGTQVGLLAIEFSSRRRMRVNGHMECGDNGVMSVVVQQAYANCPKYIQARTWEPKSVFEAQQASVTEHGSSLTTLQRNWIEGADTFFISSSHPDAGTDVSHRGGAPGFVRVKDDGTALQFPDYAGNNMFNTLGNLLVNPHAGLLFVNFASGDMLQITGEAHVLWDASHAAKFAGAQRIVAFEIREVLFTPKALPLHWHFLEASPFNP